MKKINKKGFTLIELLAVIAILAIVTIIAVTVSLSSVKTSKKRAVSVESKNVAKWISEQLTLLELGKTSLNVTKALNVLKNNEGKWYCLASVDGYNIFEEAGLSSNDYQTDNEIISDDNTITDTTCSSVRLNSKGEPEVLLIANQDGKLAIGKEFNYAFSNKELDNNIKTEYSTSEFSICGITKQDNIPALTSSNVITYGKIKSLGGYEEDGSYSITVKDSNGNVKGTITLNSPLRGFADAFDCLECTAKKCYITRNIDKYTFTGSEAWKVNQIDTSKTDPSTYPSIFTNVDLNLQARKNSTSTYYTNEIWSNALPSARVVNWENNQTAHWGTWIKHHGIYYEGTYEYNGNGINLKARIYNDGSPSVSDFNSILNSRAYFLYVKATSSKDSNVTLSNSIKLYSGGNYTAVDNNGMSVSVKLY